MEAHNIAKKSMPIEDIILNIVLVLICTLIIIPIYILIKLPKLISKNSNNKLDNYTYKFLKINNWTWIILWSILILFTIILIFTGMKYTDELSAIFVGLTITILVVMIILTLFYIPAFILFKKWYSKINNKDGSTYSLISTQFAIHIIITIIAMIIIKFV